MISSFLRATLYWKKQRISPNVIKGICVFGVICFISFLFYALWPTERGSIIEYKRDSNIRTGERIIALPGESIRVSPYTGGIYIKIKGKAYRLRERYLSDDPRTYTSESKFTSSWYTLAGDEYLVLSDRRVHQLNDYWDNFVRTENLIGRDQIIKKVRVGRRMNFGYEMIDPQKEFSISANPKDLRWHTTISGSMDIKNGAQPVVSVDYIFIPTVDNHLLGMDKATGRVLWEQTFHKTIKTIAAEYDPHLLFITIGDVYPATSKTLIAIDKKTGKEAWKANDTEMQIPDNPQALSVLLKVQGGVLTGQDKQTGATRWRSSSIDYYEILTGVHEGAVLIRDGTNNLSLIEPSSGNAFWTTTKVFSKGFNEMGQYQNTIIVHDGTTISAIDSQSGKIQWTTRASHISDSEQKTKIIDNLFINLDPQGRTRGLGASDIPSAHERRVIMTARSVMSGAIVWQQLLPNAGLHASIVADTDKQLLVKAGDGGNSYEDWGIIERLYSIDKKTGHIIFDRELPSYARIFTLGNKVLIVQKDLLCVDVTTGKILWEVKNNAPAPAKNLDDPTIDVVVEEKNNLLFIRNYDLIEKISATDGKKLWSQKVEAGYGQFYLDKDHLFLRINDTSTLYGIDPDMGTITWKLSDIYVGGDESLNPYLNSRGEIFFWRWTNLEMNRSKYSFYRFDPATGKERSIFSQVALNNSDIQLIYDPAGLYVFADDSVYELDLK